MSEPPLFSAGLILSRRSPVAGRPRRIAAILVAAVVHGAVLTGALLAPFLILELVSPPRAVGLETPMVFRPPGAYRRPGGDGLAARLGRAGADGGGRANRRPRTPPVAPERLQPTRVPPAIAPPADESRTASTASAGNDNGDTADQGDGPGDEVDGPSGSPEGCPGCVGNGLRIGDGPTDAGPFDESDPRIVLPVPLPGAHALPSYPDLARRARLEGSVVLLVTIGPDGAVGEIEVLRSPDPRWGFDLAAIDAVRRWRYRPALLHGQPVAVRARILVEFALAR